jgi:hypothetical protein
MNIRPIFLLWVYLALAAIARADPIDDLMRQELKQQHIPGMSIAVLRRGT